MVFFYKNQFLDQLSIDAENLGLLRGYSAFEYLRTYDKKPFCLKAHLHRFFFTMKKMGLHSPYTLEEIESFTYELINKSKSDCGIKWYATATKSLDGLRHDGTCEIFGFTLPMTPQNPVYYKEGISTKTASVKRPLPEGKTTAYFSACQKLSEDRSIQELLYLDHENNFLEASTSNLFFIKNKTLYTAQDDILHGITREVVLEIAKDAYPIVFRKINYKELDTIDEVFVTATNKEIMPIASIDTYNFKVGTVTLDLMDRFKKIIYKTPYLECIPELYQSELLLKT
jgi:branched-chain amino acid aminotransferase